MFLKIENIPEKMLVGKAVRMSLAKNKTVEVWQDFMRNRSSIEDVIGTDLYSIQIYDEIHYFRNFSPLNTFTKWAAIEVGSIQNISNGFEMLTLDSGGYAVFLHKGSANEFPKTLQYILREWLPQSQYQLDDRPHFELLGEKYKNNAPDSEEQVWIPIKKKE